MWLESIDSTRRSHKRPAHHRRRCGRRVPGDVVIT